MADSQLYCYRNQDFYSIRDWCLNRGLLFQDPLFELDYRYEWLRPFQIVDNPRLYVDGESRFDIVQGDLGDCWMLASISDLAYHPNYLKRVIPNDQSFTFQYAGIFHFRFWRYGRWYDVVIDDLLPTHNRQLVYTHSTAPNEFWTALMEKAYCKVLGGNYQASDAGNLCEALEDFTGGIVEEFYLQDIPYNFKDILFKSIARNSLVGTFINDMPQFAPGQDVSPQGLHKNHSYSLNDARYIEVPGYGRIGLVRIRNPWGNSEWNGAWSDKSPEWNSVPESVRQQLGFVVRDDGEFWMSYEDYITYWQWCDMCHINPGAYMDQYGDDMSVKAWSLEMIRGNWTRGVSAGGSNNLAMDPQIAFTCSAADDDNNDGLCSVVIALMQENTDHFPIGFRVFQTPNPNQIMDQSFFQNTSSIGQVTCKAVREVAGRFNLQPGYYIIVPYTQYAGDEAKFLVRIYSERAVSMKKTDAIGLAPTMTMSSLRGKQKKEPSATMRSKDDVDDRSLKELFDKVAGADGEIDWKELQQLLKHTMEESISPQTHTSSDGVTHIVSDVWNYAASVVGKVVGKSNKKNAFNTVSTGGLSSDMCRGLLALEDTDRSGRLGFNEFQTLWRDIEKFKEIYEKYGDDTHGYMTPTGLKQALESLGLRVNQHILGDLIHRYMTKDDKMPFDDFLYCICKILTMHKFFTSKEKGKSQKAEFTLEEFLEKVLYS